MSNQVSWPSRHDSASAVIQRHAPIDLAARYVPGMEVLAQVEQGKGEQVYRDHRTPVPNTYEDGEHTYYSYRIQAPDDVHRPLTFPLCQHWSAIGWSGWDVVRGVAYGVGFDFDSLVNHGEAIGLTAEQLADVLAALKLLPYIEIRRSTSGNGFHVWVWFPLDDLPQITTRIQMKALARAVIQRMAHDTGHDFADDVDHLGDILWVCAKRATKENDGLSLVQAARHPMADWPRDFRDHLDVVTRKRRRTPINGTNGTEAETIDDATRDRPRIALEASHRGFIADYAETGFYGIWNQDHNSFVCHTFAVNLVFDKRRMRGVFLTESKGTDPTKPNCWMYPLAGGGWRLFRFHQGTAEALTWETSTNGWTTCVIGQTPALKQVAARHNGIFTGNGFTFLTPDDASNAVEVYGGQVGFPAWLTKFRPTTVTIAKHGGLEVTFVFHEGDNEEEANGHAWFKQRGPVWRAFIDVDTDARQADYESLADNLIRVVARDGEQIGLYAHTESAWHKQTQDIIKARLTHEGITGGLQSDLLGWCAKHPFIRVARPFGGEYPGNRQWNLDGCKLLFTPALRNGETPIWDRILTHLGRGLDDAVETDTWCKEHGLTNGADYLRHWYATMLRHPERRLPMLALYSFENNTGKSLVHEGPAELFDKKGYMFAAKALKNQNGFDSELHGRVLCALEEIDLAKSPDFYANLKKWITSCWADFTYKRENTFMDTNFTHWVMCTNHRQFIPIEPGDERIVLWEVTPFEGQEISKPRLLDLLRKESPYFLRHLYDLDLSEVYGRVTLPVLMTAEKAQAMAAVAAQRDFPGLDGDALKAAEAILRLPKPWGNGTASQLCEALGDWDGKAAAKPVKNRANTLGRYLAKIRPHLAAQGVILNIHSDGRTSSYAISA